MITAEFPDFHLVNVYTPNAQNELRRLDYRMDWDERLPQPPRGPRESRQAGRLLRRPQRRPPGNRPRPPEGKPPQRRLQRRGTRQLQPPARQRLHRLLPPPPPRADRRLLLVVLPRRRPRPQRRLAHRLLRRLHRPRRPHQGRRHPPRHPRLRPLPGDPGSRVAEFVRIRAVKCPPMEGTRPRGPTDK